MGRHLETNFQEMSGHMFKNSFTYKSFTTELGGGMSMSIPPPYLEMGLRLLLWLVDRSLEVVDSFSVAEGSV